MRARSTLPAARLTGLLVLCLLAALAGPLEAQRGGRGRRGGGRMDPAQMQKTMKERSERVHRQMCETLKLDGQQQEQADKLFGESQNKRDRLFEEINAEKLNPREAMRKMRDAQDEYLKKIEELLDDEQKGRFELIRKEMKERRPRGGRN
ncbi:MAG: hypothetical protein FVQ81_03625 [Candidatus Glassbacteria bacterium]|nr:hypothetical protein [Candidatus Glassbacteria bacterium]